jgi:hypothetical protein
MILASLLGLSAGAIAALLHLGAAGLRARLATGGRPLTAMALYPIGLALFGVVIVLSLKLDGRSALALVPGVWLTRTAVLARARRSAA